MQLSMHSKESQRHQVFFKIILPFQSKRKETERQFHAYKNNIIHINTIQ